MGFTTGFTGGVTLTLGVAYLTVLAHERNRASQAHALRNQSRVLTSLLEPTPLPPPQTRAELAREERSTLVEAAKDRWNNEVENAVRWVQRTDWEGVRVGMEGAVARLIGSGLEKGREGIESAEKAAGPIAKEAMEKSRQAAGNGADQLGLAANKAPTEAKKLGHDSRVEAGKIATSAKEQVNRVGAKSAELKDATKEHASKIATSAQEQAAWAGERAGELRDVAKSQARGTAADAETQAQAAADLVRRSGGTIDAARGAVRDVISSGIEKGKEALGKAQAAIGFVENKAVSGQTAPVPSAVEKALHERYEKANGLNKSVEQVLEERYKPIDTRDNTVLRGV
ncbi:hypothetical protein GLAREA_10202 [Glarea lozoyensis ATCC 20868]|uniref:MICOS complex subunit MIC12 n=1 Tax=Glarea lozoyensis (strain ATCC 20868 / MF5171) TaxID=1116229 RepID=S3E839_GLAL2|nr:uncharacterized protein GLAREA_10202 [Glarea lozoyensis ATCC 20868]EPE34508.1 hypothetical protein GLAREA_10202 [Glarea lozoyensis ATCC 20868]